MERMKLNIQLFANGIIEFPASGALQGKIEWYSNGNVSTNQSYVTCVLYARRTYGATWGPDWTGSVTIDGERFNFNGFNYSVRIETEWILISSFYKTITHNSDGNKTITISGSVTGPSGTSLQGVTSSGSGNATLDSLHKGPDISYTITEHYQPLIDAGISNNVFVENLSDKYVALEFTTYDGASITNRIVYNRTEAYTYAIDLEHPNTIEMDLYNHVVYRDSTNTKIPIYVIATDSFGATTTTTEQLYDLIPYIKPQFENTSTIAKRNGQTTGLVKLNVSASFYNNNVGNVANTPIVKYKYWEDGTSEPSDSSYITINSSNYVINGNILTITDYEIGSNNPLDTNYFDFNKKYNVKLYIQDSFKSSTITKTIARGKAVWSEYSDHVDFSNITIGGIDLFPVGYIFLTTDNSFNPNGKYKGTWTKLTADAYFKIVTSNAGNLGGTSSTHKIPVSSLPSHNHTVPNNANVSSYGNNPTIESWHSGSGDVRSIYTGNTGDGQAYYPYYYGVIAWHRTA